MSKPKIYKLLFTATFVLISYAIINITDKPQSIEKETLGQQVTPIVSVTVIPTNVPSTAVSSPTTSSMTPPGVQAKINRVIDGDTIEVILHGEKKKSSSYRDKHTGDCGSTKTCTMLRKRSI
ncbi:MAG: hypothetical protein ACREHC_02930 [Candidatus Levyibacteriota bacterium]